MATSAPLAPTAPPLDQRAVLVRGIGTVLISSVLFGAMAVCVRLAARDMSALQIAFFRFLGSLGLLLALRGGRPLRPRGALRPLLLRGLLGAGAISLYYRGIEGAGAGLATLLHCTYPVSTALCAVTLMGERLNRRIGVALALSLVGVSIVLGPGANLDAAVTTGALSALGASVLAGAAVATAHHLRLTESAYLVTMYFMAVGTVCTAPALLTGLPDFTPALGVVLIGVVLTSVGGQILLHQGLGFAPATQVSLAATTTVITAAVLEALALGERLAPHTLIGAGVIVAAVALAVSRPAAAPR